MNLGKIKEFFKNTKTQFSLILIGLFATAFLVGYTLGTSTSRTYIPSEPSVRDILDKTN